MIRKLLCIVFFVPFFTVNAQSPADFGRAAYLRPAYLRPVYPQNYFRWPVDLVPDIVANMGELRPNHWHMGLDVRTGGHENERVYAAAGGYISHIGIRPSSFGRFIMIRHPNGFTTLYGHLNTFAPAIEAYVTAEQYRQQRWAIELDPPQGQLPVRQGDFISYSGNTGGSQGPHVHFEIRSTQTDECLNPLLFGFPLADQVKPTITQLGIYDRSRSIYAVTPVSLPVKNTDSGYIIPRMPVVKTRLQTLSFGIRGFDRRSGSTNQDGIYAASVYLDEQLVSGFVLDSIDYDETGYLNSHTDYRRKYNGGGDFQLLFRLPGEHSGVYREGIDGGLIRLTDTLLHAVRIEVMDAHDNAITLRFGIRREEMPGAAMKQELPVNERTDASAERIYPNVSARIDRPGFQALLQADNVYDTVPMSYRTMSGDALSASAIHEFGDEAIPVHQQFAIRLKIAAGLPLEWRSHLLISRTGRKTHNTRKAEFDQGGDWVTAAFGDFGAFEAFADVTPPTLNAPAKGDTMNLSALSRIVLTPSDNAGVQSLRVMLDGQWLRFSNDKSRSWVYVFDERCPYGVHSLDVTIEDLAGNITVKNWWFKRYPYTPPPPRKKGKSTKKKPAPARKKSAPTKKNNQKK